MVTRFVKQSSFSSIARMNQQKPKSSSRPVPFLINITGPTQGDGSIPVVHKEKGTVDGLAADYIRMVHEKNHRELSQDV